MAQCCTGTRSITDAIRTAFKVSKSPGHHAPAPLSLLRESISEILEHRKLFGLIDGLDESQQATEVGDIFHDICSDHAHLNAKVLVTGRKTESLEQVFGNDLQIQLGDHKKEVREDIQVYINSQLPSDRRLQWLHLEVEEHISETLIQDSNSMHVGDVNRRPRSSLCADNRRIRFLWVQRQLGAISPLRSLKAIRQALNKLPLDLEDTYSRILSSIPQHAGPTMRSALEWLCFCFMPLSLMELHEALAVEPGPARVDHEARLCRPMDPLTLGNSLFDLSSSGQIHFAHLSVRDYLLSPDKFGKDGRADYFKFTIKDSHRNLTLKCLTYLLLEDLSDGPAQTADNYMKKLQQLPFLKYASSAWPYHANLVFSEPRTLGNPQTEAPAGSKAISKDDDEILAVILELFSARRRGNFMAWVPSPQREQLQLQMGHLPTPCHTSVPRGLLRAGLRC